MGMRFQVLLPDGKVNHVIDLVPPNKTSEGKALELDNKHIWQTPKQQLLGSFSVLLTFWTVPLKTRQNQCIQIILCIRARAELEF